MTGRLPTCPKLDKSTVSPYSIVSKEKEEEEEEDMVPIDRKINPFYPTAKPRNVLLADTHKAGKIESCACFLLRGNAVKHSQ